MFPTTQSCRGRYPMGCTRGYSIHPLLAIVKIICDNVESLQPYEYLIGDPDRAKPSKVKLWLHNKFSVKKK